MRTRLDFRPAELAVALEQIDALQQYVDSLGDFSNRLGAHGLSLGLAMEADQLMPGLNVMRSYHAAASRGNSIALEGVVNKVWESIKAVFKKIVEYFRKLLGGKSTAAAAPKEAVKKVEEVQKMAKEVEQKAKEATGPKKVKVADLPRFVEEYVAGEGSSSKLAQMLKDPDRDMIHVLGKDDPYGVLLDKYLQNVPLVAHFLNHTLFESLEKFRRVLDNLQAPEVAQLKQEIVQTRLSIEVPGHGKMDFHEARSTMQRELMAARHDKAATVSFTEIFHGILNPPRVIGLLKLEREVEELKAAMAKCSDYMEETWEHEPLKEDGSNYFNGMADCSRRISLNLSAAGSMIELFESYVKMVNNAGTAASRLIEEISSVVDIDNSEEDQK